MLSNSKRSHAPDSDSFWNWKGNGSSKKKNEKKQFPVAKFLRNNNDKKAEGVVQLLGPGGGVGIGCGAGMGFGLVGGIGYGGWPWNHLQLVFGVGIGCGVGVGFGYGQGFGLGLSLDSLESYISKQSSSDSNKRSILY
ncbi:hypothetical protein I3843_03G061100 [Carya illinoinensis]|uniref:Uncharacterized protein n=1 Tax=Carya illinoinensis TaxID=32201 RepID=A0A8T1QZ79_CARIL|nr:hypothetical protein I3760_03G058200 [Carya illinoinensis]KAG6659856.1 hypothetical protein CIPAW_03G065200 [Carya illinoinensis]KAG7986075.1 hypothetical protein I3843_03G061100 [Carya illinoinensis]